MGPVSLLSPGARVQYRERGLVPEIISTNVKGLVYSKPAETGPRISALPGAELRGKKQRLVTVKDALWFTYLYPLRFLAAVLPCGALRLAGRLAEPAFQFITRKQKRVVTEGLALATGGGASPAARRKTARRFVTNAVVRAVDDLILNRLTARRRLACAELRGLDHLKSALAAGKGVIVVTGHFYANRLAKRHLAEIGYSMMSVRHGQPPDRMMGRLGKRFLQPRYIERRTYRSARYKRPGRVHLREPARDCRQTGVTDPELP